MIRRKTKLLVTRQRGSWSAAHIQRDKVGKLKRGSAKKAFYVQLAKQILKGREPGTRAQSENHYRMTGPGQLPISTDEIMCNEKAKIR